MKNWMSMLFALVFVLVAIPATASPQITPNNPIAEGNFGKSVASCADKFLIGQSGQNNVEVYTHAGVYLNSFEAPSYQLAGFFGESVAATPDCSTVVVGAKGYDDTGALFVFDWNISAGEYQFVVKKTAAGLVSGDDFGQAVAVTDDGTTVFGGSYVKNKVSSFARASWAERVVLMPGLSSGDYAGFALCVAGNDLGIGAPLQFADGLFGAFYINRKDVGGAGNWGNVTKFTNLQMLGYSCAGSGPRFIVGARLHNFSAHPPGGGIGQAQGAAVTLRRIIAGTYTYENTLGTVSLGNAECGTSVGLSGNNALLGCLYADDASAVDAGVSIGYSRLTGPTSWLGDFNLRDNTPSNLNRLGFSSAVSGGRGISGAPFSSDVLTRAGAAHYNTFGVIFADGFEYGDTLDWSSTVP